MASFIALCAWTDQGVRAVKDSPRRLDAARTVLEGMGGRMGEVWLVTGEHDLIFSFEAPDDACAARFALSLGMLGNVRTRTLKAFPERAYREIVASLP